MSGFTDKLQKLWDKVQENKTNSLIVGTVILNGLFGLYVYKRLNKGVRLEENIKVQQLREHEFVQTLDPISIKVAKSRQNSKRVSQMIQKDKQKRTSQKVDELKIPLNAKFDSELVEEIRYIASEDYPIERVPHLAFDTEMTTYQKIENPLFYSEEGNFIPKEAFVVSGAHFNTSTQFKELKKYVRAGPKSEIYFKPQEVRALILTCGGLCPGLNSVIREIVMSLWYNYGVRQIFGSRYGYQGIYSEKQPYVQLDPITIKNIHEQGGTWLGSSRGGFDLEKILNALLKNRINQIYIIGGDGTHAGVYEIYREVKRRKLKIAVCGIPKTIDNDIPIIDSSFGYQTSLEEAQRAIKAAWVEAHSHEYGVGLVKLMGRQAGWIAMGASYAARNVNVCLIPEAKFDLYGEKGVLEHIYQRLNSGKSCVIVVAEGAIEGCRDLKMEQKGTDKSGNPILPDIAVTIKKEISKYCTEKGMGITLKYIDPSYMIRSVPPNAQDQKVCSYVAQNAVHGCMFGFTGFSNGIVSGKNCLISLEELLSGDQVKNIPADNRQWRRLLISSGQPSFLNEQ